MHFRLLFTPISTILILGSTVGAQETSIEPFTVTTFATSFASEEGFVFDARIVSPPKPNRNGYGVLMLGGGIGNDLNWSVPGFVDVDGENKQFTITGQSHSDAPLIATTLAERGFVVMHWTTIRQDDPKRDAWPNGMTLYSINDLLRFSKSALAHFRDLHWFENDKVILLGHSLGAVRAANIALVDDGIDALVLLAPAQAIRTSDSDRGHGNNLNAANHFIRSTDTNFDGMCNKQEFSEWSREAANRQHPLASQRFEQLDFIADLQLVDWEIAAGLARHVRAASDFSNLLKVDFSGMRWTEDILQERKIDTLIVYGTLDSGQSHQAPLLFDLIQSKNLDHAQIRLLPSVGHQLGPEQDGCFGPISEKSRKVIADWLTKRLAVNHPDPTP